MIKSDGQEFHRFDRFNDRYNPTGSSRLREIFLKTDNLLKGKYLAELTEGQCEDTKNMTGLMYQS